MQTLIAIVLGCVLTYFYLENSYQPPVIFEIDAKLKAIPEQVIASEFLSSPDSDIEQKQRALSVLIKHDGDLFITLDKGCGHCLTKAAIKQADEKRISRAVQWFEGYERAQIPQRYHAIADHYQRRFDTDEELALKIAMMKLYLDKHPDTVNVLQKRHKGVSLDEIARRLVLSSSQ